MILFFHDMPCPIHSWITFPRLYTHLPVWWTNRPGPPPLLRTTPLPVTQLTDFPVERFGALPYLPVYCLPSLYLPFTCVYCPLIYRLLFTPHTFVSYQLTPYLPQIVFILTQTDGTRRNLWLGDKILGSWFPFTPLIGSW